MIFLFLFLLISTDILLVKIWIQFDLIFKATARKHIIIRNFKIVKYRFVRWEFILIQQVYSPFTCEYFTLLKSFHRGTLSMH